MATQQDYMQQWREGLITDAEALVKLCAHVERFYEHDMGVFLTNVAEIALKMLEDENGRGVDLVITAHP